MTHPSTFQPQSSDGMSEYNYMPDGFPPMSQVSKQHEQQWVGVGGSLFFMDPRGFVLHGLVFCGG